MVDRIDVDSDGDICDCLTGKFVYYSDYEALEAKCEKEADHSKFLGELLNALYGDKWETLTIHEAKKHSYYTTLTAERDELKAKCENYKKAYDAILLDFQIIEAKLAAATERERVLVEIIKSIIKGRCAYCYADNPLI